MRKSHEEVYDKYEGSMHFNAKKSAFNPINRMVGKKLEEFDWTMNQKLFLPFIALQSTVVRGRILTYRLFDCKITISGSGGMDAFYLILYRTLQKHYLVECVL